MVVTSIIYKKISIDSILYELSSFIIWNKSFFEVKNSIDPNPFYFFLSLQNFSVSAAELDGEILLFFLLNVPCNFSVILLFLSIIVTKACLAPHAVSKISLLYCPIFGRMNIVIGMRCFRCKLGHLGLRFAMPQL